MIGFDGERRVGRFCVNCGAAANENARLCESCWSDPVVPLEPMRRSVDGPVLRARHAEEARELRHADESGALARAIIFGALVTVVLTGLTLGVFVPLLALTILSALSAMKQIAGQSVDVRRAPDPRLHNLVIVACARLEVVMPPVYVRRDPSLNAFTMGLGGMNIVVLNDALVQRLAPDEILFVVGHELGHMKFGHATWLTLTSPLRAHPLAWVAALIGLIFNNWSLKTEYTADRAGLVAVGAPAPAILALARLGAAGASDPAATTVAAVESAEEDTDLERILEQFGTHPFARNRIRAVASFARSHAELLKGFANPACPAARSG